MADKEYIVLRAHIGDKDYAEGDTRVADENDVAHLVAFGALAVKAAPVVENKRHKPAVENK